MSELILHNYAMSPFSLKMRSMLGYAGLNWQSVVCREMPPRPHYWTLSREESALGMLHAHFPKQGYLLKPRQP